MKVLFYAEDAPVREDAVGFGMEKVNGRLAEALGDRVVFTVVNERRPWSPASRIHSAVEARHLRLRVPGLLAGAFKKHSESHALGESGARLDWWKPVIRAFAAMYGAQIVFVPVGSDPLALGRGVVLASVLGLPYAVYAVDDTPALTDCPAEFASWVRGARQVFGLTGELCNVWAERFGKSCSLLSLPFPKPGPMPDVKRTREIVFLGNVNPLYAERLVCLKKVVDQLAGSVAGRLTIRLTIPRAGEVEAVLGNLENVVIAPCDGPGELPALLARALACFAPYSFDGTGSVRTSFPSKTLEYLAWSRTIVCSGPEDSSLVRFFGDHQLRYVVGDRSEEALMRTLEEIAMEKPDESERYRTVLAKVHSYECVGRQFDSAWT